MELGILNLLLMLIYCDEICALTEFLKLSKNQLQNASIKLRPKLSTLLEHEFFTHDFISVHSFLTELALKSDEIKAEFFAPLTNKLRTFNEVMVANHLGGLLLSRIVLLDRNAQQYLLPNILYPRSGDNEESDSLFSTENFKQYIVPRLLQIFCVRDAQIRLLLLEHFNRYMKCFSVDELQLQILPEEQYLALLVGIKDTTDQLVAVTLRTLADIVPVLGAATVIGGQRGKLFNDGWPIQHSSRTLKISKSEDVAYLASQTNNQSSNHNVIENDQLDLPERPRPDGEEGETSTGDIEQSIEDELEQWDAWDLNDASINNMRNNSLTSTTYISTGDTTISIPDVLENASIKVTPHHSSITTIMHENRLLNKLEQRDACNHDIGIISIERSSTATIKNTNTALPFDDSRNVIHKQKLLDINELDIKHQVAKGSKNDEYNFFEDMEPIIQVTPKFLLSKDSGKKDTSNLNYTENLQVSEMEHHVEGWGDSDWE